MTARGGRRRLAGGAPERVSRPGGVPGASKVASASYQEEIGAAMTRILRAPSGRRDSAVPSPSAGARD